MAGNVALHLASGVLVAALGSAALPAAAAAHRRGLAGAAGAAMFLFAAPGGEVVAWISGRFDSMATFFTLAACAAFVAEPAAFLDVIAGIALRLGRGGGALQGVGGDHAVRDPAAFVRDLPRGGNRRARARSDPARDALARPRGALPAVAASHVRLRDRGLRQLRSAHGGDEPGALVGRARQDPFMAAGRVPAAASLPLHRRAHAAAGAARLHRRGGGAPRHDRGPRACCSRWQLLYAARVAKLSPIWLGRPPLLPDAGLLRRRG